jgi:hypothetical protein
MPMPIITPMLTATAICSQEITIMASMSLACSLRRSGLAWEAMACATT